MKMIASILLAGCILSAIAAPTANEDFVVEEDAKTYTNAVNAAKDYTDAAIRALPSGGISTNDVCAIVTNTVSEWSEWTWSGSYTPGDGYHFDLTFGDRVSSRWTLYRVKDDTGEREVVGYSNFDIGQPSSIDDVDVSNFGMAGVARDVTATRHRITRNALGLASLTDLPPLTNGVAVQMSELRSDIAAAAQSATNYTDSATSAAAQSATNYTDSATSAAAQSATNYTDSATSAVAQSATNYTDSAIADADTTYQRFAVQAPTNVNQSVQYVNVVSETPSTLAVLLPQGTGTKDWIIYVNARTNVTISLPAATWWLADTSATNDIAPQTPTALFFSQAADNIFTMGRQEFTEVVLP